jgi:hypothetical protein
MRNASGCRDAHRGSPLTVACGRAEEPACRHRSIGRQYATYKDECLARFRVLINDLLHSVGAPYRRRGGKWQFNDQTLAAIRELQVQIAAEAEEGA